MSLINKVINDLEERQALSHKNESRIFRGLTVADNPQHKNKLLTARLFAVMLFLLASVTATYALMGNRAEQDLEDIVIKMERGRDNLKIIPGPDISLRLADINTGENTSALDSKKVAVDLVEKSLKLDFSLSSFNNFESRTIAVEAVVVDANVFDPGPTDNDESEVLSILPPDIIIPDENQRLTEAQMNQASSSSASHVEYGEMEKSISTSDVSDQPGKMYINAQELYRLGNIQTANQLLIVLLEKDAKHRAARTLLAQNLIEQGQLFAAEEILRAGLITEEANSHWTNLYARLLVNKGDVNAAIKVLRSVTPELSARPDYYAFLAALYQKSGQHEDAVLTYRQILEVKPANSVWWMGLAISLESLGRNREALFAFNKALQGKPMPQDLQTYVQGKISYLNRRG